jgi:natural product precursor
MKTEKKSPALQLKRETMRKLNREELSVVAGGDHTFACNIGCNTGASIVDVCQTTVTG